MILNLNRLITTLATAITINCSIDCAMLGMPIQQVSDRLSIDTQSTNLHLRTASQMAIVDRSHPNPQLQILLPLYIYPNWYDRHKYLWKQVIIAAKRVPITAIINPNSGPDHAPPNPDYQQGIKDLHQAGVKIVGYVASNYGNRDIQAVKSDINLYLKYFKVDGIFVDEAANTTEKLSYYQQLYQYIKSPINSIKQRSTPYQVIINPGTDVSENYVSQSVADTTVIFENYQKDWTNYRPPGYVQNYSSQHFAALIHTTANRTLMKSTIDRAVKHKFGYIYITNDSTNTANKNPWDSLPVYWQAQVNYIQKINNTQLGFRL